VSSAPTAVAPAPAPKRKRGRETAGDMARSLGLILVLVVPMWFLAQPGRDAAQEVRVVDQASDRQAWSSTVEGAPLPEAPAAWRATVSRYEQEPAGLRLGWLTDGDQYVEFAATTAGGRRYLEDLTGGEEQGRARLGGQEWRRFAEEDGSVSFVRERAGVTIVVGTRRATATEDEVAELAATVR
jgi:hypothetical protein